MTPDQEREAFEKWASLDGRWPQAIERDSTGATYKYLGTQKDWTAWQARAAMQPDTTKGWQLVPKKPTEEMLKAAQSAWLSDPMRRTTTFYKAMLAAAPKPEDTK